MQSAALRLLPIHWHAPGGRSGGFWRIKGPDNTTYRLGYTANAEQEIRAGHEAFGVTNLALR